LGHFVFGIGQLIFKSVAPYDFALNEFALQQGAHGFEVVDTPTVFKALKLHATHVEFDFGALVLVEHSFAPIANAGDGAAKREVPTHGAGLESAFHRVVADR